MKEAAKRAKTREAKEKQERLFRADLAAVKERLEELAG